MSEIVADALVVTFTYGVSLRTWADTGGIERELALYERLAPYYGRILLVTYGGPGDESVLATHAPNGFEIVCNKHRLPLPNYAAALPGLVSCALGNARSVVVKTNQMCGGREAVAVATLLREEYRATALIGRGGYLWSRMAAYEHGTNSMQARDAADTETTLCTAADIVVGTTNDMVSDLCWRYALDPSRTRIIPNYVVHSSGSPHESSARVPGLVLYAGQLVKRKRVDILIEAVASMEAQARAGLTLEIIGEGPEENPLRDLAARLNAPVVFRSRVPHAQLIRRMAECAIYVQASEMEGHPKTVLEALASGAAVIVANTPGLGETITHGVTGLVITNTSEAFGQAITELLADSDWREILGQGGSRWALSNLSLNAIVPKELEAHRAAAARSLNALRAA